MKFTKFTAAALIGAMLLTGCAGSKTVIEAGKIKIGEGDLAYLADNFNMQVGDYEQAKEFAVKNFEDAVLVAAVAQAKGIELKDEDVKSFKQQMASMKSNYGGASAFKKVLSDMGAKEENVELLMKQNYYEAALEEEFAVEDPTDDELKAYMKEKYRRAKHVLITVGDDVATGDLEKATAEDILKRAQSGEDFDKLIEEKSEDPGSASNPDGYVFTDDQMVKEFQDGVDSIKPGEFTMVKSDFGYHVIQRLPLDESDAKFNELFEANKDSMLSQYKDTKFKDALKAFAEENGVAVTVNEEAVAAMTEPTPEPTDAPEATEKAAVEEEKTEE